MYEHLWSGMAGNSKSAIDVGIERAAREEGGFSYKYARAIRSHQ